MSTPPLSWRWLRWLCVLVVVISFTAATWGCRAKATNDCEDRGGQAITPPWYQPGVVYCQEPRP